MREACLCIARSPHVIDVSFIELGRHAQPDELRTCLQEEINATDKNEIQYDSILLLYGLCGNALNGLRAGKIPLVIPRAHDCCTILLGSREAYIKYFGDNPSTPFSSTGYMERGEYFLRTGDEGMQIVPGEGFEEYVEKYGEENARYIWESMHPAHSCEIPPVFIDVPETGGLGHKERFRDEMEEKGTDISILDGSLRIIENLVSGEWDENDFLRVESGQKIQAVYDQREVMRIGAVE